MRPTQLFRKHTGILTSALVPVSVLLWLGFRHGGFAVSERGALGVGLWWVLLVLCVTGLLRAPARLTPPALLLGGAIIALTAWVGLSALWSEGPERSMLELSRWLLFLGVFCTAALLVPRRRHAAVLAGVAAALAILLAAAILSRLIPGWFPRNAVLFGSGGVPVRRLNYPLGYWNGLGGLAALAVPLLLHFAATGTRPWARALSAAALPVAGTVLYLTYSRGSVLAAAFGTLAYLVMAPGRGATALPLSAATAGLVPIVVVAHHSSAIADGAPDGGTQRLVFGLGLIGVCLAVGAVQFAVARMEPAWPRAWPRLSVRRARLTALAIVALAIAVAVSLGALQGVSQQIASFKNPTVAAESAGTGGGRLASESGNGRYQYWESAVKAFGTRPIGGIGAGDYELWWSRNGSIVGGFVRDAHSWYFETLAELGIVGALLLLLLLAGAARSVARIYRGTTQADARLYAGLAGSAIAFAVAAAVDWAVEMTILPVVFFTLLGLAARGALDGEGDPAPARVPRAFAGLAWVAILLAALPVLAARDVEASRSAVDRGDVKAGIERARDAARLAPWAASPHQQLALIDLRIGAPHSALREIDHAVDVDPYYWANWYVRSEVLTQLGRPGPAYCQLLRAADLTRTSTIFTNIDLPRDRVTCPSGRLRPVAP